MTRPAILGLAAVLLVVPASVMASTRLHGTMRQWRADARLTHDMLTGRRAFDLSAFDRALAAYAADAARIAQSIHVNGARAADFKARFVRFRTDVQAVQADMGQRPRLGAGLTRVLSDCQSCHDQYKN